jgi:hypothetical protein
MVATAATPVGIEEGGFDASATGLPQSTIESQTTL